MCNLSEGIEKRGEARGEVTGDAKRMLIVVKNMIKKGTYAPTRKTLPISIMNQ